MTEQPGQAAGTAKPNDIPAFNFHTPWSASENLPSVIFDADDRAIAYVLTRSMGQFSKSTEEIEAIQRYIVACVNFCAGINPELLGQLSAGHFKIHLTRIELQDPTAHIRVEEMQKVLSDGRESFVRDVRNGDVNISRYLPGGAL